MDKNQPANVIRIGGNTMVKHVIRYVGELIKEGIHRKYILSAVGGSIGKLINAVEIIRITNKGLYQSNEINSIEMQSYNFKKLYPKMEVVLSFDELTSNTEGYQGLYDESERQEALAVLAERNRFRENNKDDIGEDNEEDNEDDNEDGNEFDGRGRGRGRGGRIRRGRGFVGRARGTSRPDRNTRTLRGSFTRGRYGGPRNGRGQQSTRGFSSIGRTRSNQYDNRDEEAGYDLEDTRERFQGRYRSSRGGSRGFTRDDLRERRGRGFNPIGRRGQNTRGTGFRGRVSRGGRGFGDDSRGRVTRGRFNNRFNDRNNNEDRYQEDRNQPRTYNNKYENQNFGDRVRRGGRGGFIPNRNNDMYNNNDSNTNDF